MEEREDTIYLSSKINELFAITELTQYFTNHLDNSIELSIGFPIKEEINISKFTITIDDKVTVSKVIAKEKAEMKYTDSIASGNIGLISSFKDESMNEYTLNIGNINPKQKVKLNTIFIQMIGSQDMSYEFDIMEKYPLFQYEGLNINERKNKIINANFTLESQSKITRLIAPFYDDEAKKYSTYEVKFNNDYKKAEIKYIKNPYEVEQDSNIKRNSILLSSFCLLFRTEKMNTPMLYYQYNPEFREICYSINFVYSSKTMKEISIPSEPDQDNKISYYSKYQENVINEAPGLFIFLVDQSGSMSGKAIELVKETLLEVIKSLKAGSYFQLIGFGTVFKKYNEEPVEVKQENVNNIINIINDLRANMGGTNIVSPLEDIYNNSNYSKFNLSKNIFLLTDGGVDNREKCIEIISTNSNKFRVHAFGIGDYFDKILIEKSGKEGKGSSSFVENVELIKPLVIEVLNQYLRPYLSSVNFVFSEFQKNIENSIISCNPRNNFTYQDEIMNYSFILDEKNKIDIDNISDKINVKIIGKEKENNIEENISFEKNKNIIKLKDGDEMAKMIVGNSLKNNKDLITDEKKEIEFATKYQILSKNTAFFAEILNNSSSQTKLEEVNLIDDKNTNSSSIRHHRRAKCEQRKRIFSCHCGKSFLSQIALNNHIKTKHTEGTELRGRGRPRKYPSKEKIDFEANKYDNFFDLENRKPEEGKEIDINSLVQEVFQSIYKTKASEKLFSKPNNYQENPILNNLVLQSPLVNRPNNEKTCDEAFYEYLFTFKSKTNQKYFTLMLKFILLFRECYDISKNKEIKKEERKAVTNSINAEGLPDLCNEFYGEFMDSNGFFGMDDDKNEIIEIIQHFCIWLFKNGFTKSKLTVSHNY